MTDSEIRIAVLLPDLLGTYGDRGNAIVLAQRLHWRGHRCMIIDVCADESIPTSCDIYLLGGGEDIAQQEAVRVLDSRRFHRAIDADPVVLAICAGLHVLGNTMIDVDGGCQPGLGLLDLISRPGSRRAIGEVVATADPMIGLADPVLTGFENHRGRTELGPRATPLARVGIGVGNGDHTEGAVSDRVIGTYLHGPVLARNPALADHILALATGIPQPPLELPDQNTLRTTAFRRAGRQRSRWRRLRDHLTPRRWTAPGTTTGQRSPQDLA
ncbi:MAG: glutamine amidotransferase [Sciscionella sp.]|nr:glutamine amidotransferase [Sciscionella sp.]